MTLARWSGTSTTDLVKWLSFLWPPFFAPQALSITEETPGKLGRRVSLQDHQHCCNHHHRDVQKNGSSQEEPRDTAIRHEVFKMGFYAKEKVVKFLNDRGLIGFQ